MKSMDLFDAWEESFPSDTATAKKEKNRTSSTKKNTKEKVNKPRRSLSQSKEEKGRENLRQMMDALPKESPGLELLLTAPIQPEKSNRYVTVMQSKETNAFFGARIQEKGIDKLDAYGTATVIAPGNVRIIVNNFQDLLDGVRGTARLLFIYMVMYIGYNPKAGTCVFTSLKEYMNARGLKDPKSARKQVKEDMYALANTWLEFDRSKRKNEGDYVAVPLGHKHGIQNGIIQFEFSPEFCTLLRAAQVMPLPKEVLTFNQKYNPNSAFFLYKIAALQNMRVQKNKLKDNIQIVSVRSIIENAPELRTYEDVMATSKAVNRYIMEPFKRDMDAIQSFRWEYCKNSQGEAMDEPDVYADFINAFVRLEWIDYPVV